LPRASSLAADLQDALDVESELLKGGAGVFDVVVDGELVFSKARSGRFPNDGEILALLEP
jgi:selT/selW/selH-like putative selenoprotein